MPYSDQDPLVRQLIAFREKMLEILADIQVDLTAYERALEEKGVSKSQLDRLKDQARQGRSVWVDRFAQRIPRVDGCE